MCKRRRLFSLATLIISLPLLPNVLYADDPFWGVQRPFDFGRRREPTVAVSVNRVIQAGNHWLAAYDRQGTQLWTARLHEFRDSGFPGPYFWREADPDNQDGFLGGVDARVIFDQFSSRFVVITVRNGNGNVPSHLYLAVSKVADPDNATTDWQNFSSRPKCVKRAARARGRIAAAARQHNSSFITPDSP